MRVLAYLITIVVATALTLGAALLIALQFHGAAHGLDLAAAFGVPFLVMGPVLIGSLAAYWDHRSSAEGRRYLGWWLLGVIVLDVAAAVCIVLAAVSAGAPVWVPVLLIGGGAVLLAGARAVGGLVRRSEKPLDATADPEVPDAAAVRRKAIVVAVTFVIAAVVSTIGVTILATVLGERGKGLVQVVLLAGQLTFTATAFAGMVVMRPLTLALRDTGGRDIGRLRRFGKVVLRGKPLPLDEGEQRAALRYARLVRLSLQFQLVFIGLLSTAIAFQFVSQAIGGDLGLLPVFFLAGMVVVLVVTVPLTLRRIRRAERYAEQHAGSVTGWTLPGGPAPASR